MLGRTGKPPLGIVAARLSRAARLASEDPTGPVPVVNRSENYLRRAHSPSPPRGAAARRRGGEEGRERGARCQVVWQILAPSAQGRWGPGGDGGGALRRGDGRRKAGGPGAAFAACHQSSQTSMSGKSMASPKAIWKLGFVERSTCSVSAMMRAALRRSVEDSRNRLAPNEAVLPTN